ncbi:HD domain-containing protein [Flavobacterium sp. DG1-102-2]|uniref:HD domain-containing protein n=1 Tax=Flavobacterium sp. DG1-102-2 TaxID=3081663 RepID=UPI00294A3F0F|nr:HD domain-containing protein [Flavobacterium sp. DG1-102-2]MDV6170305.1 HD domain-containing protein [Flavobacterium sp. DG1-102-2]
MIDIEKVKNFILNKQENEFPDGLYYHNVEHVTDVYEAVIRHITAAQIGDQDALLLKTAALFHDSGFILRAKGHEEVSCDFAKEYLPGFGYGAVQIEKICGMIMATRIPQSPSNYLEEILADADLDYLGRDDFFTISARLYKELSEAGVITGEGQWDKVQVEFFTNHHYFTNEAKQWRQYKKDAHLKILKSKLTDNN